jgi:hypothetical protein
MTRPLPVLCRIELCRDDECLLFLTGAITADAGWTVKTACVDVTPEICNGCVAIVRHHDRITLLSADSEDPEREILFRDGEDRHQQRLYGNGRSYLRS